jgi:hypothetical protein
MARRGAVCVGKREVQDRTGQATLESVNEIHAFGLLYCMTNAGPGTGRGKGSKVAVVARCGKEWDRSRDVNRWRELDHVNLRSRLLVAASHKISRSALIDSSFAI